MQILTSQEVARMQHDGAPLPGAFGPWLGPVFRGVQLFVWGAAGSGKSTLAGVLAHLIAQRFGPTVYVSAEEHLSKTVTDRLARLRIAHPDLYVATYAGMGALRQALLEIGAAAVVLDSISKADPHSGEGEDFLTWARAHGITVILVAHATKALNYRGASAVPHEVDVVVRCWKTDDGTHLASWTYPGGKNRLGGDPEADPFVIPMAAADVPRGASAQQPRTNPVPAFTTTLGEVLDRHKVRSVKRLQALVSDQTMCLPRGRKYVHEGEPGPLGFRYTRDSKRGQSQLDVIVGERLVETICAASFPACVKRLRDHYGQTELAITDQRHAKLVLGAREYARQERAAEQNAERERERRLRRARAVVKGGSRPAAEACSAAGATLASDDAPASSKAAAGAVLRPCDPAKPPKKKAQPKRGAPKKKTGAVKKSAPRPKKATAPKSAPPSGDGADVLATLDAIRTQIEAL